MAVVDLISTVTSSKFNQPTIEADSAAQQFSALKGLTVGGSPIYAMLSKIVLGASDNNASIYRLFPGLAQNLIPLLLSIGCTANANATDYDLGIWEPGVGGVVGTAGASVLADALDLHLAIASLMPGTALDGLSALTLANWGKTLGVLSGDASVAAKYDIALQAAAAGTGGSTVTGLLIYTLG